MGKYEDADLILKLYDLRREETMRKARNWMAMFNPESAQEIVAAASGEHNAYLRMVMSYWDMAASLVNNGAIDEVLALALEDACPTNAATDETTPQPPIWTTEPPTQSTPTMAD